MMKLLLSALALGSVEAFKVNAPLTPAAPKLPSLENALALRGGGMVDQGMCTRAPSIQTISTLSLSLCGLSLVARVRRAQGLHGIHGHVRRRLRPRARRRHRAEL